MSKQIQPISRKRGRLFCFRVAPQYFMGFSVEESPFYLPTKADGNGKNRKNTPQYQ